MSTATCGPIHLLENVSCCMTVGRSAVAVIKQDKSSDKISKWNDSYRPPYIHNAVLVHRGWGAKLNCGAGIIHSTYPTQCRRVHAQ